ncbi:MAG: DUF1365 domain-containing protein, partial [Rhodospirillaceae bacterium]|nr:DUF1365 domain-containing protein [Rhodospirillaceae bacterium]
MSVFASSFYTGTVMHRRTRPRKHKLSYNVFSMLIDLDELEALNQDVTGFGFNRFSLFSFYNRDHGPGLDAPLKPWIDSELKKAGIDTQGGPVRLLCYPRVLGYTFNPLSVYFCYHRDGRLAAILHQVTNTFHQRHSYLFPVDDADNLDHQACVKEMYVSPFIGMGMTYNFKIKPPADEIAIAIQENDVEGPLLYASFAGHKQPFSSSGLLNLFLTYPLMTLKVIGGIHWEALLLWIKGV